MENKILYANCHLHSLYSDGDLDAEQIVELAVGLGHRALILTDHDTVRGCYFLEKAARKYGIKTLYGCEFSTLEGYHLCGFDFNTENEQMRALLKKIEPMQTARSKLLFEWGQKRGTLRTGFTWQDILDAFPDNNYICNNQVRVVAKRMGIYSDEEFNIAARENFSYRNEYEPELRKLIAEATAGSVPSLEEVVIAVRAAGGVPVIAHPGMSVAPKADMLREMGVMGFEIQHPGVDPAERDFFISYCDKYGLYKCGGTDHSTVMAGRFDSRVGPARGGMTEEDFMKLYNRELG